MKVKRQWFRKTYLGGSQAKIHDIALAADGAGNLYFVGWQEQSYGFFLTKISCAGNELWRRRIEQPQDVGTSIFSLASDRHDNIYVIGVLQTQAGLGGGQRSSRAWLTKFSTDGERLWQRTLEGQHHDWGIHLAADGAGDLYLVGASSDHSSMVFETWLAKISAAGEEIWRRPIGKQHAANYALGAVAADWAGNVCFLGATEGTNPASAMGVDKNVRAVKFSPDGAELWRKEFGTVENDVGAGLGMDSEGNIYLAGFTDGALTAGAGNGGRDGWVMKLASDGTELWRNQIGTTANDTADALAVDGIGNIYISGSTDGALTDGGAQGKKDFWVAKFSADGDEQWRFQLGTDEEDIPASMAVLWNEGNNRGFAVDGGGNIYLLGYVAGGNFEIKMSWLAKLCNVPETIEELDELNRLRFQTLQEQIAHR